MPAILLEIYEETPAPTRCGRCGIKTYLVRVFRSTKTHFKVLLCDVADAGSIRYGNPTVDTLVFRPHRCAEPRHTEYRSARPVISLPDDEETNRKRPKGCGEHAGFDRRFEANETIDPDKGGEA